MRSLSTKYNGYHFRSRTEARWAIFFEEMGIRYYYEFEDYLLPGGVRYLPDFYLPEYQGGCLAEVKGRFTDEEKQKCRQLADLTGLPVLLLEGVPDFKMIVAYGIEKLDGYKFSVNWLGWLHERGSMWVEGEEGDIWRGYNDLSDTYRRAVNKSRAARFEFLEPAKLINHEY